MRTNKNKTLCVLALSLAGFAGGAIAQDSAAQDQPASKDRRVIEEVIVSATKRDENLRDIPASIAAFGKDQFERLGAEGMEDYMKQLPGVTMNTGYGVNSNRPTVRGASLDTATSVTSNTVGIFIGDVSLSDPFYSYVSPDLNGFDLASVEILKGPQGTLFGGSALSGAVRYNLAKPDPQEWAASLRATHVDVEKGGNTMSYAAMLNAPITETLALRVVGLERKGPGVYDDDLHGTKDIDSFEQSGGRVMLSWAATDKLMLDAVYLTQESMQDDLGFADGPEDDYRRDSTAKPITAESNFDLTSLRAEYDLGWAQVIGQVAQADKYYDAFQDYSRIVSDPPPDPNEAVVFAVLELATDALTYEFRLVSDDDGGPWKWLVGYYELDYQMEVLEMTLDATVPIPDPLGLGLLPGGLTPEALVGTAAIDITALIETDERAIFGELRRTFWEQLEITLGLRVYEITTEGQFDYAVAGVRQFPHETVEGEGENPKLAINWFINDRFQLYASGSKGFRHGGVQQSPGVPGVDDSVPDTFASDDLLNYEIGLRSDWLEGALQADITLFYINWEDAQYYQSAPSSSYNAILNIAEAQIEGVDASLRWLPPIDGLDISVAANYTDARTSEPFDDVDGNPVAVGTRLPGSARFSWATSISYFRLLGPWEFDASLSWSYQGQGFSDIQHRQEILDLHNVDIGFGIARPDWRGMPRLRLIVNNAHGEKAVVNALHVTDEQRDNFFNRPRTMQLQLSLNF